MKSRWVREPAPARSAMPPPAPQAGSRLVATRPIRPASTADVASLRRLKSLVWLSDAQLARLAGAMDVAHVSRRNPIFLEGEASSRVYVLMSGVAKLSFRNRDHEPVMVALVGAGEIFGASSLLPAARRPFSCDAFSDCRVGSISPEPFVDITLGVPLADLSRTLDMTVSRWWTMLLRYTNFIGLGLRERLAAALLELAAKFGVRDARGMLLTLKLTHADLADLVGASRQRTTEQLSDFERARAIIRDGRRLIIVTDALMKLVAPDELD